MNPLVWGHSEQTIKEKYKGTVLKVADDYKRVYAFNFIIHNFQGDCGALYISGANTATVEQLKNLENFASEGGWSKLFATIVTEEDHANKQLETFKKAGWRCISKGYSNRNSYKRDYVMFKRVKCSYRGY